MKVKNQYLHSELTSSIISAVYKVFNILGTGFLESVYEKALQYELTKMGIDAHRQERITVSYDKEMVGDFRADLIVNNLVILEIKAVEALHEIHETQLINYLKATEIEVGLLINFGRELQIKRKIYTNDRKPGLYTPSESQ